MQIENSSGRKISGFVLSRKMELKRAYEQLINGRIERMRSPIFDLPEFDDLPFVSVCSCTSDNQVLPDIGVDEWELVNYESGDLKINECSRLNALGLQAKGRLILFCCGENRIEPQTMVRMNERIVNSNEASLCLYQEGSSLAIAVTSDLFYELKGIDELFERASDGLIDFALRCEMTGVSIISLSGEKFRSNTLAHRNVKKSRLVVNQGSPRFEVL